MLRDLSEYEYIDELIDSGLFDRDVYNILKDAGRWSSTEYFYNAWDFSKMDFEEFKKNMGDELLEFDSKDEAEEAEYYNTREVNGKWYAIE